MAFQKRIRSFSKKCEPKMGLVQMSRGVVCFESELTSVDLQNNPNPAVKRPMPFKWIAKEKRIHLLLHKNGHQLDIFKS